MTHGVQVILKSQYRRRSLRKLFDFVQSWHRVWPLHSWQPIHYKCTRSTYGSQVNVTWSRSQRNVTSAGKHYEGRTDSLTDLNLGPLGVWASLKQRSWELLARRRDSGGSQVTVSLQLPLWFRIFVMRRRPVVWSFVILYVVSKEFVS